MMKKVYLSIAAAALAATGLFAAHANNNPFFSDKQAVGEEAKKQQAFQEAWKKVESERKQMMQSIQTNHVAPQVPEYQNHNIDIAAIAARYEQGEVQQQRGERVYVFVTLDMPKETLKRLAQDVRKLDGAMVVRGFHEGSLKKTYQKIADLGLSDANIQINPEAFHKYKIKLAPSFVVVKKLGANESLDMEGCALPEDYIKITGDVSLKYALEKMVDGVDDKEDKQIVKQQLSKLG